MKAIEALLESAEALFHANKLNEAIAILTQVQDRDPRSAEAYYWLGRIYEKLGAAQQALDAFENALRLDPTHSEAYLDRGLVKFLFWHDYPAAIDDLETSLRLQPEKAFGVIMLGVVNAHSGQIDRAFELLHKGLEMAPDNVYGLANLAILHLHRGQHEAMMAVCRRQIDVAENNHPHRMLGLVLTHQQQYDAALDAFAKALALEPNDYESRAGLAHVYHLLNQPEKAAELLQSARQDALIEAEYGQACVEAIVGNYGQAVFLLQVALQKQQLTRGWARIDPEFAFMGGRPDFEALVQA